MSPSLHRVPARPARPRIDVADRLTWLVVVAAAFALAGYTFEATSAASAANGQWQEAVRAEARHTSATLENIRKVYEDDAPVALSIIATAIRAQELDRRADADSFLGVLATAERATARTFLDVFRRRLPDSPVTRVLGSTDDPEAAARTRPLGRQLAALRAVSRQSADSAASLWSAGDGDAAWVRRHLWGMVASAMLVLAGLAVWERWLCALPTVAGPFLCAAPGRSGVRTPVGAPEPPAAVVGPPPSPAVPPDRPGGADRSSLPAAFLAVLAVAATALQIDASTTENRRLAEAATGADRVGTVVVGSGPREAFAANGQQLVVLLQQRADDVADAGSGAPAADGALADVLAATDRAAAERTAAVVADLASSPTAADGLDPLSAAAVSASQFARDGERRAQAAAVAAAEAAGARSDALVLVLLTLTLAANAVEIGHSSRLRGAGPRVVRAGWALAVLAVLLGIRALLTG